MEYSENYSKRFIGLYQYCRNDQKTPIIDCKSFKFKSRFLNDTTNEDIINAEIAMGHGDGGGRGALASLLFC